jgi:hypothetical protein
MTAQKDTGSILTANSSQWTFGGTGCLARQAGLLSPDGIFGVKRPAILEGLFEKSFCSTKLVPQFLHS